MSRLIAQINLQDAIKISEKNSVGDVYSDLGKLIGIIVPNLFLLAGVLFLFLLIFGGFSIISSDSAKGVEDGKQKITSALIGFLVMFSAYWIVQIVEYLTGVPIL
jgi:hypothetical protein